MAIVLPNSESVLKRAKNRFFYTVWYFKWQFYLTNDCEQTNSSQYLNGIDHQAYFKAIFNLVLFNMNLYKVFERKHSFETEWMDWGQKHKNYRWMLYNKHTYASLTCLFRLAQFLPWQFGRVLFICPDTNLNPMSSWV